MSKPREVDEPGLAACSCCIDADPMRCLALGFTPRPGLPNMRCQLLVGHDGPHSHSNGKVENRWYVARSMVPM